MSQIMSNMFLGFLLQLRLLVAAFGIFFSSLAWAADANPFAGHWIEQADDPLKITLQPLADQQVQASITHGYSDQRQIIVYQQSGQQLLDAAGIPVYTLENGKLRKLGTPLLVLFVRSGSL